jgi:long-chain acyl-CoA synthetase
VGRARVVDEATGEELPQGAEGTIYFSDGPTVRYHKDPTKSDSIRNDKGWLTVGDIGRLDEDGYLYLTDRKAFMIISGGVNIYPQETENTPMEHPAVADVAVLGVPDAEYGETVKAVVQLRDPGQASPAMAAELIDFCRGRISKCPRSVDFMAQLPRLENDKLYKQKLRDSYHQRESAQAPAAASGQPIR